MYSYGCSYSINFWFPGSCQPRQASKLDVRVNITEKIYAAMDHFLDDASASQGSNFLIEESYCQQMARNQPKNIEHKGTK